MDKVIEFATREEAEEWVNEQFREDCMDNVRFCYTDDDQDCMAYEEQREDGCCGSFDADIIVAGRPASIGCNYGH